jgi:putative ABC transport system permease protein
MSLSTDIRHSLRRLARTPTFTTIAVSTLALGIGASTALFAVVNATLLRPLPYSDPASLVQLSETDSERPGSQRELSYPDFLDLRERARTFAEVAGYNARGFTLGAGGGAERVQGVLVMGSFFRTLGVGMTLGRDFGPADERPGAEPVVILGHGLWQREYGGDPAVLGKALALDGAARTVVGVLPRGFQFAPAGAPDLWVPFIPSPEDGGRRYFHWVQVVARLGAGAGADAARADLARVAGHLRDADSQWHARAGLTLVPLHERIVGPVRPVLLLLMAAATVVLLVACANLASLLLVRAQARRREMAIRRALGAAPGRLRAQVLTEAVLIGLAGGALAVAVAPGLADILVRLVPAESRSFMPYLASVRVDLTVLAFSLVLSISSGLLLGLPAALRAGHRETGRELGQGRTTSESVRPGVRDGLVVAEVALALVLLTGAGLLVRSVDRLRRVDPGFDPRAVLTLRVSLPPAYLGAERSGPFYAQLIERVRGIPGVVDAAAVDSVPLSGGGGTGVPLREGRPEPRPDEAVEAHMRTVTAGYFRTMRVPLVKGRGFEDRDRPGAPRVVVVNRALGERLFPGEDAIGQRVHFAFMPQPSTIVGIVGDEQVSRLDLAPTPVLYFPHAQDGDPALALLVRISGDPRGVAGRVREEVRTMEPAAPVHGVRMVEEMIADSPAVFLRRLPAVFVSAFAALSLLLAALGLYGLVSYSVATRIHELGIRLALGAPSGRILRMVLGRGLLLAAAGAGLGLAASLAVMRLLSGMLFGVSPTDPATFAAVAALLAAVATIGSWLPARRAARVDPLVALRE